ncbi:AraC-family transcriptional regulator [Propionibacterium freudenreichii]|nr:AraC-family transcriptional regulator [Propionibacterium freudenreichii]
MPVGRFSPVLARTRSIHAPISPIAYDCVKLIFVRSGSAVLLSEFGEQPVAVGDVVALGANTLCGSGPEGWVTVTTLYLDLDCLPFLGHAQTLGFRALRNQGCRWGLKPPVSSRLLAM